MAALGDIIKINDEDYANLKAAGSAGYVINGVRYYYDPNNIYLTPNNSGNVIALTWQQLKVLRDNADLIPGAYYRITDYQCTTSETNTSSAGHQFDIIVRADSSDKLNEQASAIQHEGDTYFANSKLEAWKLWYCLDNDYGRFFWVQSKTITIPNTIYGRATSLDESGTSYPFAWVSSGGAVRYTNTESPTTSTKAYTSSSGGTLYNISSVSDIEGQGVIYRMIDEYNNDIAYDFKNLLFSKSSTYSNCYTFTISNSTDASLNSQALNNKIGPYYYNKTQRLNRIVIYFSTGSLSCRENVFEHSHDITHNYATVEYNYYIDSYDITSSSFMRRNTFKHSHTIDLGDNSIEDCIFDSSTSITIFSMYYLRYASFLASGSLQISSSLGREHINFHNLDSGSLNRIALTYNNCDIYLVGSTICYRHYNVPTPYYPGATSLSHQTSNIPGTAPFATNHGAYFKSPGDGILWFMVSNDGNTYRDIYIYQNSLGWTTFTYAHNGYGTPGGYQIAVAKDTWVGIYNPAGDFTTKQAWFIPMR